MSGLSITFKEKGMEKDMVHLGGVPAEVSVRPSVDGLWTATANWRGIRYEAVAMSADEALDALASAVASASGVKKDKLQRTAIDVGRGPASRGKV